MITRDISLEDCILDLLDNSLDGAWRHTGSQPMTLGGGPNLTGYEVDIVANAGIFSITDNCGGLTLEDAAEHAFSFGRGSQDIHDDFSIGVYGIGMKRAVFKLGREILIRSTVIDDDGETLSFSVPIDVPAWLRKNDLPWDFDILEYDPLAKPGVAVEIENLTAAAREAFRNPAFIINLRRMLARDYSLHLARGLRVSLNGEPIVGITFELRVSDAFIPMRFSYPEETEGDVVIVEIIGGMAAAPPDSIDPSENEDGDRRMGWYVVCNGRIVLAADKTIISGWGSELWPQWHQQYSGFVGIIFFNAPKAIALPLTTTKRSVDVSSEVWRRARPKMREVTKAWITYTN